MSEYAMAQVQWYAEWGQTDGSGYFPSLTVEGRQIFPSEAAANDWLDRNGWPYDSHALRRHRGGYSEARVRKVIEENPAKWQDADPDRRS